MARLTSTLAARIAFVMLAAHAVLLPGLYFGLTHVTERELADQFIAEVRGFSRVVADEFEIGDALDSADRTRALLDSAILRGDGAYAELRSAGVDIRSALGPAALRRPTRQDLDVSFGGGGDDTYFLMLPIEHGGRQAELWLGFDERPIVAAIAAARSKILTALGAYLLLTMSLGMLVGWWLSRPLIELKRRSRRVASGDYALTLDADTTLREVVELSEDLDRMRSELVGIGERLRREVEAKELAESGRLALEEQLRRRDRLEMVGTLAGGVAHEFNNALVPIILYTESLLVDAPAHGELREQLDGVLTAARRAREIVRKVLTFSRTYDAPQLQPIRLETVVDETLQLFTALVPPSIEVRREVAPDIPPVLADQGLLAQLLMNLCTNGFQAMPVTGGVLTVGVRLAPMAEPRRAPAVELYVRDTGHGMDAATMQRIFEPFFTTREVGSGTGLGLAVAHGIATTLGASIHVESAPGQGATFRVRFPPAPPGAEDVSPAERDVERAAQ